MPKASTPVLGATAIHAYCSPRSTLKTNGAGAFGKARSPPMASGGALCPVHSYDILSTETLYNPRMSWCQGPGTFGKDKNSGVKQSPSAASVHAYQSDLSTLRRSGVSAFPRSRSSVSLKTNNQVHAYSGQLSTLRRSGGMAFSAGKVREVPQSLCRVHSYSGLLDRTKQPAAGPATFGKDAARDRQRTAGPRVHAYSANSSTLFRGGATFGRTPARPTHFAASFSRSGLVSSAGLVRSHPAASDLRRPTTAPALKPPPQHRAAPPPQHRAPPIAPPARKLTFPEGADLESEILFAKKAAKILFTEEGREEAQSHEEAAVEKKGDADGELSVSVRTQFKVIAFDEDEGSPTSITASPLPKGVNGRMRAFAASPAA